MIIQTIRTCDEFLDLRDEWNALLHTATSDCIFLSHEWLSTWWKYLAGSRRLHILTARDGASLVGVLPVAERPPQVARMMPRVLEFLGSGTIGSDYLDAIVAKGREAEVLAAFADHLHRRRLMLQLSQLRGGSNTVSLLAEELRHQDWQVTETKINVCPYIDLTGLNWETYLATLGPSVRKNIQRYLRNLPKVFNTRLDCVQSPAEASNALAIAIDLHHKRWGSHGTSEAFQSESIVAFHRDFVQLAANRGWLRLLILSLNEAPAAALYGLRYGPTFYFYQSGFDPAYGRHSVGAATMGLTIKTAIEEGASEYDFLHGDEEYKFHWARGVRNLTRLELHPPHGIARIYRRGIQFNRAARRMVRRVLMG
jgi:CelD/BcsL family acetyltransferase involved in cellulose biosynthesis